MKSKEEILELAKTEANDKKHESIKTLDYQDGIHYGFIEGYSKCQEENFDKTTLPTDKEIEVKEPLIILTAVEKEDTNIEKIFFLQSF